MLLAQDNMEARVLVLHCTVGRIFLQDAWAVRDAAAAVGWGGVPNCLAETGTLWYPGASGSGGSVEGWCSLSTGWHEGFCSPRLSAVIVLSAFAPQHERLHPVAV